MANQHSTASHNNYSLAILFTAVLATGFSVLSTITAVSLSALGDLPSWVADLIYTIHPILFISQLVSGSGYLNQFFDRLTNEITLVARIKHWLARRRIGRAGKRAAQQPNKDEKPLPAEPKKPVTKRGGEFRFIMLTIGLSMAVVVTIIQWIGGTTVPFNGILNHLWHMPHNPLTVSGLGHSLMLLGNLSLFGGLGNRIGRGIDYVVRNKTEQAMWRNKDVNYTLSIMAGLLIGAGLVAALAFVVGPAVLLSSGPVLAILTVTTIIGNSASATGYIGRVFDAWLGQRTLIGTIQDAWRKPAPSPDSRLNSSPKPAPWSKEQVGNLVGVGLGIALAAVLIASGVGTVIFGVIGFIAVPMLFANILLAGIFISGLGGLGNRLGYMLDKHYGTSEIEVAVEANGLPLAFPQPPTETQKPQLAFSQSLVTEESNAASTAIQAGTQPDASPADSDAVLLNQHGIFRNQSTESSNPSSTSAQHVHDSDKSPQNS